MYRLMPTLCCNDFQIILFFLENFRGSYEKIADSCNEIFSWFSIFPQQHSINLNPSKTTTNKQTNSRLPSTNNICSFYNKERKTFIEQQTTWPRLCAERLFLPGPSSAPLEAFCTVLWRTSPAHVSSSASRLGCSVVQSPNLTRERLEIFLHVRKSLKRCQKDSSAEKAFPRGPLQLDVLLFESELWPLFITK